VLSENLGEARALRPDMPLKVYLFTTAHHAILN